MLTDDLLELQRLDTTADQLTRRRANSPERTAATEARAALEEHRRRRTVAVSREQELELAIDSLERDGEQLAAQRARLEAQLKTVVAPREAEALMHELQVLGERRDALDDQELAALDEQSQVAEELSGLEAGLPHVAQGASAAQAALTAVEAEIDAELAAIVTDRERVVARLDAPTLERYERLRARHGGVAVARLEGSRCSGCHLDLSTAELDEVRAVGSGGLTDCPQCGRLLVA